MPDSISSFGEPMAPAVTITSVPASMRFVWPFSTISTPMARPFSTMMRLTRRPVRTVEIGAAKHRLQIAHGGTAAAAIESGGLIETGAFLLAGIEIRIVRHAEIHAALHIGHATGGCGLWRSETPKWTVDAMVGTGKAGVAFRLDEVWLEIVPAPAGAAMVCCPAVVILRAATGIDFGVDRASAAQHAGLRIDRRCGCWRVSAVWFRNPRSAGRSSS